MMLESNIWELSVVVWWIKYELW